MESTSTCSCRAYSGKQRLCNQQSLALTSTKFEIIGSDGARSVRDAIKLSHEPPVPQLWTWFYEQDTGSSPTTAFWNLCLKRSNYQTEYQDYWNSTQQETAIKQPVDGVIMPVAPSATAQHNKFTYFGQHVLILESTLSRRLVDVSISRLQRNCQLPRLHRWLLSRHFCRPEYRQEAIVVSATKRGR